MTNIVPLPGPDVFVQQEFEDINPVLALPTLPAVVIGINNQIEYQLDAGTFDGSATTYSYPSLILGSTVDTAKVSAFLSTTFGVFQIADGDLTITASDFSVQANPEITRNVVPSATTGATSSGTTLSTKYTDGVTVGASNVLQSATASWVVKDVGRRLSILPVAGGSAQTDAGEYVISGYNSATEVTVTDIFGDPVTFTGDTGLEIIARQDYSSFTDDKADYLDDGVTYDMDVVIESGADTSTLRIEHVVSDIELHVNNTLIPSVASGDTTVGTTFTDTVIDFVTEGVRAGDTLVLEDTTTGADEGSYTVVSVTDLDNLVVTPAFSAAQTGCGYRIVRNHVTASSLQYRIDQTSDQFTGNVLVSYTARRNDQLLDLQTIANVDELKAKLGPIHPDNPLAFGVFMASLNTDQAVYALQVEADAPDDHTAALEYLESQEVYGLAPLTQIETIHQIYSAHVTQASGVNGKHERVAYINAPLYIKETRLNETDGVTDGTGEIFTSAASTFISDGVVPGDFVFIDNAGTEESGRVLTVDSETQVTLVAPGLTDSLSSLTFRIESKPLDKTEQATRIGTYSQSFANRRVFNVWPDVFEVEYQDETTGSTTAPTVTSEVPGYYAGCVVAGLRSGVTPEQPFTNYPLAGISALKFSNKYFNEDQLDIIAGGGTFILVQDVEGAPVYARRQLSTDISRLEFAENSITSAVDYAAKFFRNTLRPYIGKYNITKIYLEQLAQVSDSICKRLIEEGNLGDCQIGAIRQSETEPDKVEIDILVAVLYPANKILVTLII